MGLVRQAHMPGNYESYDEPMNRLGSVICKMCWERFNKENLGSMNTVWVSYEGRTVIWWLCDDCTQTVKVEGYGSANFLESRQGILASPGLDV